MLDGAPFQGCSVLEKDGLLHQPNDIILPDNRVSPVPMEQYTLYEFRLNLQKKKIYLDPFAEN